MAAPAQEQIAWHAVDPSFALATLESRQGGLTRDEVTGRRALWGANALPAVARTRIGKILLGQVNNPIVFLLLGSAAAALALGKIIDGIVVLGAIVVNVVIGAVQEVRAGRAIEALSHLLPRSTVVVRDGQEVTIESSELVPGDLVLLASGDWVPADLRLIATRSLRIEEAALTGESVPTAKDTAPVSSSLPVADRTNMAFGGTLVASGTGRGVVVATGSATELGQISHLIDDATELQTPLTRVIASVGKVLTLVVLGVAVLLFVIALVRGYSFADGVLVAITLAVASIPEGLPAIITIALAIGVQRMAVRRAIVRKLPSVETLGSTTVICSDKTGTLTRNAMTVQALVTRSSHHCAVSGVGYEPVGEISAVASSGESGLDEVRELVEAGVLCSDASLLQEGATWKLSGDPTEGALVVAAKKAGVDCDAIRVACQRLDVIPFESEQQFMATLHQLPDRRRVVFIKGAPEVVLRRSAMTDADRAAVTAQIVALTDRGMRVLAIGRKAAAPGAETIAPRDAEAGFEFLGLQGMMDPPRPEAIAAIRICHDAGITVKMITGDHVGTAVAIARQLGILSGDGAGVTGLELSRLGPEELQRIAVSRDVFARVAPEHKLALVQALQAQGHVVAMTGDGVNDAPALKQANIGVAMGITGTAVSKEAADIVLADDNFATIAAAVEEGRRIYDNLLKSIAFVLPANLGLGLILVTAVSVFPVLQIAGEAVPLMPMLPTQMLWVNLVTSVTLSLPLAFERLEQDAMRRPPRLPSAPVLGRFVIIRTILVAVLMCAGAIGLFWWEYWTEVPLRGHAIALREAQTMVVLTVVSFQVFYMFNCRSLRAGAWKQGVFANRSVFVGIAVLLVLQAGFTYLPFMHQVFGTAALQPKAVVISLVVGAIVLPAVSLEKALWNRRGPKAKRTASLRLHAKAAES